MSFETPRTVPYYCSTCRRIVRLRTHRLDGQILSEVRCGICSGGLERRPTTLEKRLEKVRQAGRRR